MSRLRIFFVIPDAAQRRSGIQRVLPSFKAKTLDYSPHPRLALRAIGCADVRYGIPAFAVPLSRE
jgi:hypothetical protein